MTISAGITLINKIGLIRVSYPVILEILYPQSVNRPVVENVTCGEFNYLAGLSSRFYLLILVLGCADVPLEVLEFDFRHRG
jgi:hypothetical protein